jgi:hypothetical protein
MIYDRMKEEGKLIEVYRRSVTRDSAKDIVALSPDVSKGKKSFNFDGITTNSPNILYKIRNDENDDLYVNVQSMINKLRQREFDKIRIFI